MKTRKNAGRRLEALASTRMYPGQATHKMARAICGASDPRDECDVQRAEWWKRCESASHHPYMTVTEITERKPVLADADEAGRRKIERWDEEVYYLETPNLEQIPVSVRVHSGNGIYWAIQRGCREVTELGYARFCDFGGCWAQPEEILETTFGHYCCEDHAIAAGADLRGVFVDVMHAEHRREQFDKIRAAL